MTGDNKHIVSERQYVIAAIVIVIVLVYIMQLFYLQIYQNKYKDSANSNAFFNKTLYPARGTVFDRNGKILVYNKPTYDIVFIPREIQDFDTLEFCRILNISLADFKKRMDDVRDFRLNPGYSNYTQQTFMTHLTPQEYGLIQERLYRFPGFSVQNRTIRDYNYQNAGNILGYIAEVSRERMVEDSYYRRGDYEGKSGIERSYENELRGEKGVEILLRDAHGRIQGKYENGKNDISPVSGKNLTLSVDMDLQAYGEYLMQGKLGSIVMIEPETGEILCMVSAPTFDPSKLTGREFRKNYKELEQDHMKPLFNRTTLGVYPPGSTFKTTQGLVFLQEGIITPQTSYACHGGYPPLGGKPGCHPHAAPLPLPAAIATSCNSYFCYGLNAMLSNRTKYDNINDALDVWKDYLVRMGFGHKLGVDLPSEKRGFIPNSKFYVKRYNTERWMPSFVISIAIGQGEITATPLQIANLVASIANRGYFYTPHLVKQIQGGKLDERFTTKRNTQVASWCYEPIIEGMAKAVTAGTCRAINLLPEIEVCGKTGTSENPHGRDHSLFMGFAPRNSPKVAISVIVENGGFGSEFAVPIARLMVQKYLKGNIPDSDKPIEHRLANTSIQPGGIITRNFRTAVKPVPTTNSGEMPTEEIPTDLSTIE